MTDRALANAEHQRDRLAAQINVLNQKLEDARRELAAVENFIKQWHLFADSLALGSEDTAKNYQANPSYPQGDDDHTQADPGEPRVKSGGPLRKNPDRNTVGVNAKKIISDLGRPVPREELFEELAKRGLSIRGKDPQMVLSTIMWRMPEQFIRLAGHGYWLRELPWAAAGYEGGREPDLENQAEEEFALMKQNVLDPGGMADAEPDELIGENGLPVGSIQFDNYILRPQRSGAGWQTHIEAMNSSEPTRTTMTFSDVNAAVEEAKRIVTSGARFIRRV